MIEIIEFSNSGVSYLLKFLYLKATFTMHNSKQLWCSGKRKLYGEGEQSKGSPTSVTLRLGQIYTDSKLYCDYWEHWFNITNVILISCHFTPRFLNICCDTVKTSICNSGYFNYVLDFLWLCLGFFENEFYTLPIVGKYSYRRKSYPSVQLVATTSQSSSRFSSNMNYDETM